MVVVVMVPGANKVPAVVVTVVETLPTTVVMELSVVAVVALTVLVVVTLPLDAPNLLIN